MLIRLFKEVISKLGIDKAVAYSSGSRVIAGFTGVISLFFISVFLTGVEQGFYFTFGSIIALQVFFELGLTGIITQFVAHEASHLVIDESLKYQGDYKYKSRLSSLIHFCVKWYFLISVVVLFFLIIVGFSYFSKYGENLNENVEWKTPWILICIGTAIKLFQSPFTSVLTGLGFVKETSKIGFYQQIIIPVTTWIGLACGLKLYVISISYLLSVALWFFFVLYMKLDKVLIKQWRVKITEKVDYIKEIFPYQWKIALSWISGYFIFQLFNPVLFATEGAIVAGQMGLTLQVLNTISAFSMSWINTKVPLMSNYIAQGKYSQLDMIFNKTLKQMNFVSGILLMFFLLFVLILKLTKFSVGDNLLGERFLGLIPILLMMVPIYLQQYTNAWATYLRCHKREPYLILSIVAGIMSLSSTFILGSKFGLYGITIGYFCIRLILFPWGYKIFTKYNKLWHNNYV